MKGNRKVVFSMLSCWYEHTGSDPDDEARGKDKNWSEGTVEPFSGIMAAVTLSCFATGHVSFSAMSQAVDELPAPHTSQKLWCRHGWDAARALSVTSTDIWPCRRRCGAWEGFTGGPAKPCWDRGWSHHEVPVLPAMAGGWSVAGF